jgi:hypothetical protein
VDSVTASKPEKPETVEEMLDKQGARLLEMANNAFEKQRLTAAMFMVNMTVAGELIQIRRALQAIVDSYRKLQ